MTGRLSDEMLAQAKKQAAQEKIAANSALKGNTPVTYVDERDSANTSVKVTNQFGEQELRVRKAPGRR
ncbi:MAG TPA: hypothetical protein VGA77_07775 [Propylenella sp.]